MGFGNALGYGLASGANSFAEMFARAIQASEQHRRQMELMRLRKGPQLPPGVTGETDRDMRDENKQLGREFGAAVGAPKGVTPDVKYGVMSPEEKQRLGFAGGGSTVLEGARAMGAPPDARGGRSFNTGFADASGQATPAELARFRAANTENDRTTLDYHPTTGAPMVTSFSAAMRPYGFGEETQLRERMLPDARLNADIASSPFAQTMRDAANRAALAQMKSTGVSPAKTVERAPQAERGDLLARLATLEPAAQQAAASALGKHLGFFGQRARQQALADAASKAQTRASIGTKAAAERDASKSETRRIEAIQAAVTETAKVLQSEGQEVTPAAIAARNPGMTEDDISKAMKSPRPKVRGSGEDPEQAKKKLASKAAADKSKILAQAALNGAKKRGPMPEHIEQMLESMDIAFQAGLPNAKEPTVEAAARQFGISLAEAQRILQMPH